jgi:hypothetical protein
MSAVAGLPTFDSSTETIGGGDMHTRMTLIAVFVATVVGLTYVPMAAVDATTRPENGHAAGATQGGSPMQTNQRVEATSEADSK